MGGGSSKATSKNSNAGAPYDPNSPKLLDHYALGETLGRGAFGVVKAATLNPSAIEGLEALDASSASLQIARRKRFAGKQLAVKVMRQERSGGGSGDSSDRLQQQIALLQQQVHDLETSMDSGNIGQLEELQWLTAYIENLQMKQSEKARNQTKNTPREMMLREVALLEKCDHGFIIQLIETFEEANIFCVIFERCHGSIQSRFPEGVLNNTAVARQSYQLVSAVAYLHRLFIMHRDIKPENLMLRGPAEDAEVLLGDFGLAIELRKMDDRCQGCAGTPHFVAPEGFHSYYQSFPSDVWSCGCTVYWMLLGQYPYEVIEDDLLSRQGSQAGKSFKTTAIFNLFRSTRMGQILSGWKPQFEHDQTALLARKICHPTQGPSFVDIRNAPLTDEDAIDIISSMLQKLPKQRCLAEEALRHPWIARSKSAAERSCRDEFMQETYAMESVPEKKRRSTGNNRMDRVVPAAEDIE